MRKFVALLAAVLVVGLVAGTAQAGIIPVPNASFESPDVADGANNKSVPPNNNVDNWSNSQSGSASATNHIGVWDPAGAGPTGLTGEQHVRGYMTQTPTGQWMKLTSSVVIETCDVLTYSASADFMNGGGAWNVSGQIQLLVGGSVVASTALTTGNVSNTAYGTVTTPNYVATASGQDVQVQILFQTPAGSPLKLDVDNVQLIPEPATMALLAFGGLGILIRRRRR